MLTVTFSENTNDEHEKRSSETLDGKGTSNPSDSNHEVYDGSESGVESEGIINVKIGDERENPGISRSVNDDYSKTDTNNGTKTILVPDGISSSSLSLEMSSNDFFQAREVNSDESSASESASKDEHIDVSHGSSKSIVGERDDPSISGSDNNGYLIIDTDGIKSILIHDEESTSSSSSESSSNDFLQSRRVKFAKSSASESTSKDEDSNVSHENSGRIGGEGKNLEISRSDNIDYLKTDPNYTKRVLVRDETSSSSSLSESSSNDFFQTRKDNFAESPASKFASKDEETDVSPLSSIKSEPCNDYCASTSPIYNLNHGHMSMSPTVAPPVQVMDRSSEYDSFRIPSSVFAANTNPMDWTNDSDESLFSIQLGNHSLARDHLFTSPELRKSLELTKSGELDNFSPKPSVLIEDRDTCRKSDELEDLQRSEMSDERFKLEGSLDKNKSKVNNSHPDTSSNSHGNGIRVQSSSLPMEKNKEEPLCCCCCCCFFCNWAFCCFKLPSCCCCCHTSPVLPEEEDYTFVKIDSPQADSTSNCCNSCHCFSWLCCTSCCSHTESPRQPSDDKASEKASSSTSNCCSWFQCCSWGKSGSKIDSPQQQSDDKAFEKTSSSTSSCFNCFHCCSWCCYSSTESCSQKDSSRQQSFIVKTSEKSSSSTSNCCSWSLCSSGKSSCHSC